jgi:hypothetical protein
MDILASAVTSFPTFNQLSFVCSCAIIYPVKIQVFRITTGVKLKPMLKLTHPSYFSTAAQTKINPIVEEK